MVRTESFAITQRLPADASVVVPHNLELDASDRQRSRHRFETATGVALYLRLPRGTVLQDGDLLLSEIGDAIVRVVAKAEPVLVVTAASPLQLLRAAYHLGNRHVPVEVTETALYLSPDPVLAAMLEQLGVEVAETVHPFQPEMGAYHSHKTHHHHAEGEQAE